MSSPVNYQEMNYDKVYHRYVPTQVGLELAMATKLEQQTHLFDATSSSITADIEAWLTMISDTIYDWIYSETPIGNHAYIEYMFAYDQFCIKVLWKCMVDMARYDISSGGMLVGYQHGINIERAKLIDRKSLRGRIVIPDAVEKKLRTTGLLTAVDLPYTVPREMYRVNY